MRGRIDLKTCPVILVFLLVMVGTTFAGQTIYVDADANGLNNGSSWPDAYNYLQNALGAAASGDEIRVAEGIYKPPHRSIAFWLKNGVSIRGGYAGFGEPDPNARDINAYETILSGDLADNDSNVIRTDEPTRAENSLSVVESYHNDPTTVLDGFTVTGGNFTGIIIDYTPAAPGGGGIRNISGSPTLINCTFYSNSADHGGGMLNSSSSSPTLINCTFSNNFADDGGGMYNEYESNPTLNNCTFSSNLAHCGGGMYNIEYSSPTLTNCTFSNNSASGGGGMFNYDSSPTLTNCTFSNNSAGGGGGMYNLYDSSPTLTNCILWGNVPNQIDAFRGATMATYSDVEDGWPGQGNIDADPCFADPCNGDYHLKSQAGRWEPNSQSWVQDDVTSPCIDAGDMSSPIGYEPFPNGGMINMGAYGGTAEASKSYFGSPVCETIIAGDINGDCKIDFLDFALMSLHWLEDNNP